MIYIVFLLVKELKLHTKENSLENYEKYFLRPLLSNILAQDCIENGEGASLHANNGDIQNSQDPQVTNVPWSNFDGEHLLEYWELEEMGLIQFVCDTFDLPSCP